MALLFNPVGALVSALAIDEVNVALPFNLQIMPISRVGLDLFASAFVGGELGPGGAGGAGLRISLGEHALSGGYFVPRFVYSSFGGPGGSIEAGWAWHWAPVVLNLGAGVLISAGTDEYEGGVGPLLNFGIGVGK